MEAPVVSPRGLRPPLLPIISKDTQTSTRGLEYQSHLTLIVHLEPRSVLGVVAVEVDDGQVGGAQQDWWNQWARELSNQSRAVLRPSPDLQEVVVVFRREVLELNTGSCEVTVLTRDQVWMKYDKIDEILMSYMKGELFVSVVDSLRFFITYRFQMCIS